MHGVPANLDLSPFHGSMLERIDLGMHIIHFRFAVKPLGQIGVEGNWELFTPEGVVMDRQEESSARECFRLHVLLGSEVTDSAVFAPEWFELSFDSGHRLRIYDSSRRYESFSIQPGNIHV